MHILSSIGKFSALNFWSQKIFGADRSQRNFRRRNILDNKYFSKSGKENYSTQNLTSEIFYLQKFPGLQYFTKARFIKSANFFILTVNSLLLNQLLVYC